jgi:hypothetical protein
MDLRKRSSRGKQPQRDNPLNPTAGFLLWFWRLCNAFFDEDGCIEPTTLKEFAAKAAA